MKNYLRLLLLFSFFAFHFSFIYAQNESWMWASYGKDGWTHTGIGINIVAADNFGNCYYTGFLSGDTIKFGSNTLIESKINGYDIFVVKFEQNGNVVWAKQSTQNGNNSAIIDGSVVSTDAMGNAYIMANFSDTIVFSTYILTSQQAGFIDNFLVKYDPNGNVIWARQSQIPSYYSITAGYSLSTDIKGNSYINGEFIDTVSFSGETLIGLVNSALNNFLVKYDANGNVKWARQSTGYSKAGSRGQCVSVNNYGVYAAGDFYDSVTFGSFKLKCPTTLDGNAFIVKYDTNGSVKWARQGIIPSSHNFAEPRGITADNFGNVYVTGLFWDTLIFGKDTLVTINDNVFLVKYDSNGNVKWAMAPHVLDNNTWGPTALSSDNRGDIFMSGQGGGFGLCKICFGNDTLSINDTSNFDIPSFVIKFDSSGKVVCASINLCGGNGNEWNGISSDTSGNYVYFGGVAGTVGVFGNDTIDSFEYPGAPVPFVARWKECDATLGVNNITANANNAEVKVFPNPNNGVFTISLSHAELVSASQTIEIYNMLGEKIYKATLKQVQGNNSIDLTNQPNGVYFYRVIEQDGGLVGSGKVVIQK